RSTAKRPSMTPRSCTFFTVSRLRGDELASVETEGRARLHQRGGVGGRATVARHGEEADRAVAVGGEEVRAVGREGDVVVELGADGVHLQQAEGRRVPDARG